MKAAMRSAALSRSTTATWRGCASCWRAITRRPPILHPRKRSAELLLTTSHSNKSASGESSTKKDLILEAAHALGKPRFTPAEIEQIRRQLISQLGASGKTSSDYVVSVLEEAGMRVVWSTKSDTE